MTNSALRQNGMARANGDPAVWKAATRHTRAMASHVKLGHVTLPVGIAPAAARIHMFNTKPTEYAAPLAKQNAKTFRRIADLLEAHVETATMTTDPNTRSRSTVRKLPM
jgi:hypothetical protein